MKSVSLNMSNLNPDIDKYSKMLYRFVVDLDGSYMLLLLLLCCCYWLLVVLPFVCI